MEGVTKYVYRNAFHEYFGNVDKYYAPFVVTTQNGSLKNRELQDILPENNKGITLVPQILSNNAADVIDTMKLIKQLGYEEINLNLGCPSGTVVAKQKGSGMLKDPARLDAFLEEIYAADAGKISIKTRIGIENPEEFAAIMEIYNKYPMHELIIHPRLQKDFYKNTPNLTVFGEALAMSKNPVCYNGDIFSKEDYDKIRKEFPSVEAVMLGRGLIANPGLISCLHGQGMPEKAKVKEFHDKLLKEYQQIMSGDRNTLFKMKEVWFYLHRIFTDNEKYMKKIRKAQRMSDYEAAVASLFREQDIAIDGHFHL